MWEETPVLLVSAGAGAGKTTVLSAWAAGDETVSWVTLDAYDNDPVALWTSILASFVASGCASHRLADLRIPRTPLMAGFVHDVAAELAGLQRPVWLVLDDLGEVTAPAALETVDLLLRLRPAQLRVVLSARHDPPLPALHDLRLALRLWELRAAELRFNRVEAAALLATHDLTLRDEDVAALTDRVEGWAAGLRLAGLTLAGARDPGAVIGDFGGDSRAVADYLVQAVLARLADDERTFLLRISVCSQVSAALASALTGLRDAGAVLERLARVHALDTVEGGSQRWYRCHALLRGYLQAELRRIDSEAPAQLHRRAADWFAAESCALDAIEHAVAACDAERVRGLVDDHGLRLVLNGDGGLLREVFRSMPDRLAVQGPAVALVRAAAALDEGDLGAADRHLRYVGDAGADRRHAQLHAALRLWRSRLAGDATPALDDLDRVSAADITDPDVALLATVERGVVRLRFGDVDAGEQDLADAERSATMSGRDALVLDCQTMRGVAAGERGELPTVRARTAEALAFARTRGWEHTAHATGSHVLRAWAAVHAAEFDVARSALAAAEPAAPGRVDPTLALTTDLVRAVLAFEDGAERAHRREAVRALRRSWNELGERSGVRGTAASGAPLEVRMCLRLGERTWAREAVERARRLLPGSAEAGVAAAALQACQGRWRQAREELAPALASDGVVIVRTTLIDAHLLLALTEQHAGRQQRAFDALCEALRHADALGTRLAFVLGGPDVHDLLLRCAGRFGRLNPFADAVRQLAGRRRGVGDTVPQTPLTATELALLAELPSLRTVGEIADVRRVSSNTVKTHLRAIYTKLGVNSRRAAVAAAYQLGLL